MDQFAEGGRASLRWGLCRSAGDSQPQGIPGQRVAVSPAIRQTGKVTASRTYPDSQQRLLMPSLPGDKIDIADLPLEKKPGSRWGPPPRLRHGGIIALREPKWAADHGVGRD